MRMKMVCDDRTLAEVANEFLALKKAQKVRERTLNDYKKYIDKFLEQSQNSLDVDVLKIEILEYLSVFTLSVRNALCLILSACFSLTKSQITSTSLLACPSAMNLAA